MKNKTLRTNSMKLKTVIAASFLRLQAAEIPPQQTIQT